MHQIYVHTADPVANGQKVVPVHYIAVYCRPDKLYARIWRKILVFHFVSSSTFMYGYEGKAQQIRGIVPKLYMYTVAWCMVHLSSSSPVTDPKETDTADGKTIVYLPHKDLSRDMS